MKKEIHKIYLNKHCKKTNQKSCKAFLKKVKNYLVNVKWFFYQHALLIVQFLLRV